MNLHHPARVGAFSSYLPDLGALQPFFANDYSDGIRGTDQFRAGPPRLTGGGKVNPRLVLYLSLIWFALAAVFGSVLIFLCGAWWLFGVGFAACLAGWFYTGGKHPYGYAGFGELFVLVFFGYVATVGTVYTQTLTMPVLSWIAGTGIGLIACALLMVNNIRDIDTDQQAGKRTLAVRLGDQRARIAFICLLLIPVLLLAVGFFSSHPIMVSALILIPWATEIAKPVVSGAKGAALIAPLRQTGFYEIGYALTITAGIVIDKATGRGGVIGWAIALMVLIFWGAFEFTSRSKRFQRLHRRSKHRPRTEKSKVRDQSKNSRRSGSKAHYSHRQSTRTRNSRTQNSKKSTGRNSTRHR